MAKPNLILGDCLEVLKTFPENSFDAIVTDPPYGLTSGPTKYLGEGGKGFMGKAWDHGVPNVKFWKRMLRVAKPGTYLLAFGGTRTHHRLMCAIEDAGWEIRDCLLWLYGSGFPKSHNISKSIDAALGAKRKVVERIVHKSGGMAHLQKTNKEQGYRPINYAETKGNVIEHSLPATKEAKQYDGYGTALKPAWEPVILARKPLVGTVAANVLEYGTGGINIDGCRIAGIVPDTIQGQSANQGIRYGKDQRNQKQFIGKPNGRWPANLILGCACDGEVHDPDCVVVMLDKQSGVSKSTGGRTANISKTSKIYGNGKGLGQNKNVEDVRGDPGLGDCGGASRFFYCAKASKAERGEGNVHPTVKPLKLMRYLCKLVTPTNGHVLDPFMGSGTTGLACQAEGFAFTGIEQSPEYLQVAWNRLCKAK